MPMEGELGKLVVSAALRDVLLSLAKGISSEAKGTVLFRRGDAARGLYFICRGRVSLSLDEASPAYPPRILGPGAVVGLPSSVAGSSYSLTAEVVENAELAFIPRSDLISCLSTNQHLCFEVMEILSGEISGTRTAIKKAGAARPHKT
jgi:CRP-like cAMP-binding protein